MITSNQNKSVRFIYSLKKRKVREEYNCFFVEGLRAVSEGINAKAYIRHLVVSESFLKTDSYSAVIAQYGSAYQHSAELVLLPVTDGIFASLCETETPQGIGAVFILPRQKTEVLLNREECTKVLVIENLQDPGNMGTIIRTADAAGFHGIFCTKGCVDVTNSKVLRSTVGSIFHVPVMISDTIGDLFVLLKKSGFLISAAHPRGTKPYYEEHFTGKHAIVIGNEANGLSDQALQYCDQLLAIPMPGQAESLNASVAAALMMYETVRK